MRNRSTRRDFLATTAATGLTLMGTGRLRAMDTGCSQASEFKTTLHKSLIGQPTEKTLTEWKAAGFEGMEISGGGWNVTPEQAAAGRATAEKLDMRIHSVLRGWTNFNNPNEEKVAADIAGVETALRAAEAYGADAVLLVPCRVGGMPVPKAFEFDIEFDEKTGHVQRVVQGDNSEYQAYIAAQNLATDTSRKAVEKLIPTAEKAGVVIALENVWNNLWVKPALFRHFVASFDSPWVQAYFDIGNHAKYAPPEEWIRTLGKLLAKLHVKDFLTDRDQARGGSFRDIRDGGIDWPAVRKAIDQVGYNGWMTIEGSGGLSLEERSKRLDLIIAGK